MLSRRDHAALVQGLTAVLCRHVADDRFLFLPPVEEFLQRPCIVVVSAFATSYTLLRCLGMCVRRYLDDFLLSVLQLSGLSPRRYNRRRLWRRQRRLRALVLLQFGLRSPTRWGCSYYRRCHVSYCFTAHVTWPIARL